eukprot:TRINITY_DN3975_c0_g1_i1.p1 TRINITY_DN3975_c0_g1~~TRINITY_DN3975_c0_g1_i1.p1  ORF type:complete len:116 (+),score=15.71 TRINITY_DN3975_c0_g1_i1:499-846(+)
MEYELILQEKLTNLGVSFFTEVELRKAYYKTPDIYLKVPISIWGVTVNWIESKASFGTIENNTSNLEQFWGYQSRYGPGIVIYWFGFQEAIRSQMPDDVLVADDLPTEDIVVLSV